MKKLICLIVLAAMALCLFCGCKEKHLSQDEVYEIVFKAAGVDAAAVTNESISTSVVDGVSTYTVTFTVVGTNYTYVLDTVTGEIISHTP